VEASGAPVCDELTGPVNVDEADVEEVASDVVVTLGDALMPGVDDGLRLAGCCCCCGGGGGVLMRLRTLTGSSRHGTTSTLTYPPTTQVTGLGHG